MESFCSSQDVRLLRMTAPFDFVLRHSILLGPQRSIRIRAQLQAVPAAFDSYQGAQLQAVPAALDPYQGTASSRASNSIRIRARL